MERMNNNQERGNEGRRQIQQNERRNRAQQRNRVRNTEYTVGFRVRNNRRTQERQQRAREQLHADMRRINFNNELMPDFRDARLGYIWVLSVKAENMFVRMLADIERVKRIPEYHLRTLNLVGLVWELRRKIRQSLASLASVRDELERRAEELVIEEDHVEMCTTVLEAEHWVAYEPISIVQAFACFFYRFVLRITSIEPVLLETKLEAAPLTQQQLSGDEKKSCCVCIEDFQEGDRPKRCPQCQQCFHGHCILRWLTENETCPYCRHKLCCKKKVRTNRCLIRWIRGENL